MCGHAGDIVFVKTESTRFGAKKQKKARRNASLARAYAVTSAEFPPVERGQSRNVIRVSQFFRLGEVLQISTIIKLRISKFGE